MNYDFYENFIHGNTTLRFRNALSSPTDQMRNHSFYNRPRFFKIEYIIYVKNELDKRPYKSPYQLRLLRNRNRNRNSLYQSINQSQSKNKRRNHCNRQLRRTLRRRKASAITTARPAASRS